MSSGEEAVLSSTQGAAVMKEAESDEFEQTKPGKGAITSQFYRTTNIPERFNNPDYGVNLINNPGNPVFSCTTDVNASIIKNTNEDCFEGYSTKKQNPMYLTSAMEYGRHRPTVHTMPTSFHAKCQKFTEHLGKCGMYRNQSLNTAMDKSIV